MAPQGYIVSERCDFKKDDWIDNAYKVEAKLGEGTFGQVFKVHDRNNNVLALKLLKLWEVRREERPGLLKRFEREYETGLIKSDYLVTSINKGTVNGNAYIVMEFCQSGDLAGAKKNLTQINFRQIATQILLGLKVLHENGKVHRDLKPENVLLKDPQHAVLTDFGIAGDQNNRLTQRGLLGVPRERFGTIAYMPPEQLNPKRGNATVLPTTDIFSFGVMMYQMLTGKLPFGKLEYETDIADYSLNCLEGKWDRETLKKVAEGKEWLPAIEQCLVPNFQKRIQSIDELLKLVPKTKAVVIDSSKTVFKRDSEKGILLRIMQGEEIGKTYNLNEYRRESSILTMGRESSEIWNHLALREIESCYISRCHCTLEYNQYINKWVIRDGQWRQDCPTALRSKETTPCSKCTALCSPAKRNKFMWKYSLNGTFVNSVEVDESGMALNVGDIISIGDMKMRVEGA